MSEAENSGPFLKSMDVFAFVPDPFHLEERLIAVRRSVHADLHPHRIQKFLALAFGNPSGIVQIGRYRKRVAVEREHITHERMRPVMNPCLELDLPRRFEP